MANGVTIPIQELTPRQKRWLGHIQNWQRSGGSMKDYAAAHDLVLKEFYHWKRWLGNKGLLAADERPTQHFQRVPVAREEAASYRVTLPNGVRFDFPGPLTLETLTTLFRAAGAAS